MRSEVARQETARAEAERQAAAQREAQRQEALRAEAASQASARLEALQQEAMRAEAARQEAARAEAERQLAAQQDASRQEAERQAAARAEAAQQDAARLAAKQRDAQEEEARREARLRAIGQQLNEEADRREAAARRDPSHSPLRRGRLFGRSDPNQELVAYAEAMASKIERNMSIELVRDAARLPHTQPVVTVAVRSDGTVESVAFIKSSGVAAIDAAVTRIVPSQANYPAFPPALARAYDVVEIRRTWHFDMAVRLY
jgi:TonB family protein